MKTKKTYFNYIVLLLGVLVVLNILADRFFLRLDLTEDKRYTLSTATKDILRTLDEPVTITAYFTKDLPVDFAKGRRDFKELLVEYAKISGGNVMYEFVDPGKDEETEREAAQKGVQALLVDVSEKDQRKQQKAYMGAVIQSGEEKEVLPVITPKNPMEYELTSAIKKLSVEKKPLVGFIEGHGEPAMDQYGALVQQLSVIYQIQPVNLTDSTVNLNPYAALVWAGAKDTVPQRSFMLMNQYLAQGGNLFLAFNTVMADFNSAQGLNTYTGLADWLQQKGVVVESSFVIDQLCGNVTVNLPNYAFPAQINFPYFPIIKNFGEHTISKGLEAMVLQIASPISYYGDTSLQFTPLLKSSENSGLINPPLVFDAFKQWQQSDFQTENLILAAALEKKGADETSTKMVIISNGDFAVSGQGRNQRQVQADNINFLANAIEWLTDETGLAELRTKGVTARLLDNVDDGKRNFLKYLNFMLPVLLIIIYGAIRMQRKRNIRIKRMEDSYV